MKKLISFLLASIILFSSVLSFAAPGDFINIGNKKYYNMKTTEGKESFIKDLKDPAVDKGKIYREVPGDKYVNVDKEEKAQAEVLNQFLQDNNIKPEDLENYLKDPSNLSKVVDLQGSFTDSIKGLPTEFGNIDDDNKGNMEDYIGGNTYAPKLASPGNYSRPVPGSKENNTQILELKSYAGSTKWLYNVVSIDTPITLPKSDSVVEGTIYTPGKNIAVTSGDSIILYATDLSNKVKAYDIIKVEDNMILKPRVASNLIDIGTMEKGTTDANAIKITEVPEGNWKYFIKTNKLSNVFVDDTFNDAIDLTLTTDIVVANSSTIIDDNFKRFIYLINIDGEQIKEYVIKEIKEDDLSKLPEKLVEGTNYVGPVQGGTPGTTKLTNLDLINTGGTEWVYKIGKDIKIPIADSKLVGYKPYTDSDNLTVTLEDNVFLAPVDADNKIKAYEIFTLNESNVSGNNPSLFTISPEKGSATGTTMVKGIELPVGATKWMYAVVDIQSQPFLDRVYAGSKDYNPGDDINAKVGQTLYIFATDPKAKVKQYGIETPLKDTMIKSPPAMLLSPNTHYRDIGKGINPGETKVIVNTSNALDELLDVKANLEWKYIISKDKPKTPEFNMNVSSLGTALSLTDSTIIVGNEFDIKAEDPFNRNLLLLATEKVGEESKVRGYAIIALSRKDIKFPESNKLNLIPADKGNYSKPEPGSQPGTTKFSILKTDGIDNHSNWYYKVSNEPLNIEYKQSKNDFSGFSNSYTAGQDIIAKDKDYIVLVSADSSGKILAYENIQILEDQLTAGFALEMKPVSDYEGPQGGNSPNSTKFTKFYGSNDDIWLYKRVDKSAGKLISGTTVENGEDGFILFNVNDDIEPVKANDWILLVRTDANHKLNGYANIQLKANNIRGDVLADLKQGSNGNFELSPGARPSTTKIINLNLGGIDGYPHSNWKWMYKVIPAKLTGTDIPYLNQKVNETPYTPGKDIDIVNSSSDYILLLATDSSNQAKAYAQIQVSSDMVQPSAPIIAGAAIANGTSMDSVIVTGLIGTKYKSLITKTRPMASAVGDIVPSEAQVYLTLSEISIRVGEFLTIYEHDENNKIIHLSTFEIKDTNIIKGTAKLGGNTPEDNVFLEGSIVNGGVQFKVTLTGATWIEDIKTNKIARDKLFNGFKANNQTSEWAKVVASMINDGSGSIIRNSNNVITILLPQTLGYNIADEQNISLTIPADAIKGALNSISPNEVLTIKPTVQANISGTVVSSIIREEDIKAGGATIEINLLDGEWVALDADKKEKLIDSFNIVGTGDETNLDHIKVALKNKLENIVRTNSKKVTITLPPVTSVAYGSTNDVISLKIMEADKLVENATEDIVATPNFTLYPDMIQVVGNPVPEKDKVFLMAPDYRVIDEKNNTWTVNVTTGKLKESINNTDVIITGLPKGITATASKLGVNQIEIKLTGNASVALTKEITVNVKVKGQAVTEPNSIDSIEIPFTLSRGDSMMEEWNKVKVNVAEGKIMDDTIQLNDIKVEFSLNSTNGINGDDWKAATTLNTKDIDFKPGKVFIREESNHKVFKEIANLSYPKAPVGITAYDKTAIYDTDTNSKTIELSGLEVGVSYEFSVDGGKNWNPVDTTHTVSLKDNSDLRIKYGATSNSLSSLATVKLNGLYLGNISMNVAEGKIFGTTAAMEYSLNNGDSFANAGATTTNVNFVDKAKVIIRDKSKPMNSYYIGEVGMEPILTNAGLSYDISNGTITDATHRGLQYRIANDPWKDLSSTETENKLINFKQGKLEIRTKGTEKTLPSEPIELGNIEGQAPAPELTTDDYNKDISYWNGTSLVLMETVSTLKYKINDEEWQAASNWATDKLTSKIKNGNPKVSVVIGATTHKLASLPKVINFTGNLTFENVKLNVADGQILGTTTSMQYSIDSIDGLGGTWNDAKKDITPVQFAKGMKVYVREKSKPFNREELTKLIKIDIEDPITIVAENDVNNKDVDYSIIDGTIYNRTARVLEYRFGDGQWITLGRAKSDVEPLIIYGVVFTPGLLQFRAKGTETNLPSPVATVDIKSRASKPQLKYDNTNYTIEKIGTDGDLSYEYSTNNGGIWTQGTTPTQFEGGTTILVRLKATKYALPSMEQDIPFTKNLDLYNVIINAGKSQLENTSTLMEYSLDSENGEDGLWFACSGPTTTLVGLKENVIVHVREKAKPRNYWKVKDVKLEKQNFDNKPSFVTDNLDFNILQKTISFKYVPTDNKDNIQEIVNNLQYRIGINHWIDVDYVNLEDANKVLAYNVNFIQGNLEFRLKGDLDNLPSDSIFKYTIKASAAKPNVSVGFNVATYRNEVNGSIADLEYSFAANGPWIDGAYLTSEDLDQDIFVRTKAKKDTLPSLNVILNFKPVLNLNVVTLSDHVSPVELNGTTDKMQYSINGTEWKACSKDNTILLRKDGKTPLDNTDDVITIKIRDSEQLLNEIPLFTRLP